MKVLVTGTAGLLGANYSRHLLENGHTVIGIDNFSGGYKAFLPKDDNLKFYKVKKLNEMIENMLAWIRQAYKTQNNKDFEKDWEYELKEIDR